MTAKHWTDEELMFRLYGLEADGGRDPHLAGCAECGARWLALTKARSRAMAPTIVTEERLRAQRQAIFERTASEQRWAWLLPARAPAAALACALVLGLYLNRMPAPQPEQPAVAQVSDEKFFNEIAALVDQDAPRASDPLRGLFVEQE